MSQLVRLEGKHTAQTALCAVRYFFQASAPFYTSALFAQRMLANFANLCTFGLNNPVVS